MGNAKHIGRVGALAVALGLGTVWHSAKRVTVTIGVAALVVAATAVPAPVSTVSPAVKLSADSTALILCGTGCPTPDAYIVDSAMNQFITPTHPGQTITPVAVTTPSEAWPITGLLRLMVLAVGDPGLGRFGGPGWPDEPWWKLSGFFDLTADQSVQAGVADLEAAMAAHGNDNLVIFGYSMGANTANKEKRKLAAQYPPGTTDPDINFVLIGDPNLPNGGLAARFPGLPTVILGTFDGPEPTNTQFHTDVITRQYDGAADFPLYPLNVIADLNAVLGFMYVHSHYLDAVSLPSDPTTSPAYQGTHGDSSYYFFPTEHLPLFAPLRQLGVPEPLIDVVEPFFRVLVELGYDRSIPPWEPTPARLIPTLDPAKVTVDLVNAVGEGVNNALALVGAPPLPSVPAPVTLAAPATESATADIFQQVTSKDRPTQTEQATVDGNGDQTHQQVTVDGNGDPAGDVDRHGDRTHQVTSAHTPTRIQQVSSAPAGASASSTTATLEPSASASTPKPEKPSAQPTTARPVMRGLIARVSAHAPLKGASNGGQGHTPNAKVNKGTPTVGPSPDDESSDGGTDDS